MFEEAALRGVVFDLDGLIVNTEDLYDEVGVQLLQRRGKVFTPALKNAMMGLTATNALPIMIDWHELEATVPELAAETDVLFPAILDAGLKTMPGFMELLDALDQAGIPRGVATSSHSSFARDVLSRCDVEERFQFVLTAENVTHGKPDPEIYEIACARLGLAPAHVMVLEDSENGCRAAVAAGAFAVAVPGTHGQGHDFEGCRFIAESLASTTIYQALNLPPPTSS